MRHRYLKNPDNEPFNVKAGETVSFQVNATDPEENNVTLSVVGALPKGASFDAETGAFTWETSDSDSGKREITFKALDEYGASTQKTVTINIESGQGSWKRCGSIQNRCVTGYICRQLERRSDRDFGAKNFLRTSYGTDSKGTLGTAGGSDNKVTYLKFDVHRLTLAYLVDRVKLQMTLLVYVMMKLQTWMHSFRLP